MKAGRLNPELRRTYRFIPNTPVSTRLGRAALRFVTSRMPAPRPPAGVSLEVVDVGGDVPRAHVFTPASNGSGGALLYIHGGGMVIGTVKQDYPLAIELAQRLRIVVVLPEYRLAPEHPYPVPLDDCARAWAWLAEHAQRRGIDSARLAVGGQSAGGGLAAMLAQRRRDAGGAQPAAQWLFCPMLDDRTAADRSLDQVKHFLWNNKANRAGWRAFLGTEPGSPVVPDGAVPSRRVDLTGLPPTWIGTGTIELFHAEDVGYAEALRAAHVPVTLDEVPGAPHAFESVAATTKLARDYRARATSWLAERLSASPA